MVLSKTRTFLAYLTGLWKIYFIRRFKYLWKKYNILRSSPRRCLEYRILPYIYAHREYQNILFVGVAGCTVHYEDYLSHKKNLWTIDLDPEKAVSGMKGRHFVDSIENIDKYFWDGQLDAVIMNGVYGWGLDDETALDNSLKKIFRALRPGGLLVFGWDKTPKHDPIGLDDRPHFSDYKDFDIFGRSRIELDNKHHHIYSFHKKPE